MLMMPNHVFTISYLIFGQAVSTSPVEEVQPIATPCRTETTVPDVEQTPVQKPVPAEEPLQKRDPSPAPDSGKLQPNNQEPLQPEPPADAGILPRKAGDVI